MSYREFSFAIEKIIREKQLRALLKIQSAKQNEARAKNVDAAYI
jgi:hypothetical protein